MTCSMRLPGDRDWQAAQGSRYGGLTHEPVNARRNISRRTGAVIGCLANTLLLRPRLRLRTTCTMEWGRMRRSSIQTSAPKIVARGLLRAGARTSQPGLAGAGGARRRCEMHSAAIAPVRVPRPGAREFGGAEPLKTPRA